MTEQFKITNFRDDMMSTMMLQIRFNRFDMKFMSNIQVKYLSKDKPLSEGQNELYEKLIHKYRKQFKKLGASYKDIVKTPWKNKVVTKKELLQKTLFRIKDNTMLLTFNFDKKMIDEVRELVHDDKGEYLKRGQDTGWSFGTVKYDFVFNNDTKIWLGPFNTYLFRSLYYFCSKHSIQIDDSARNLMTSMISSLGYKDTWTPHVETVDGTMYVSQLTESMLPYVDKIDMTDTSVQNVEKLTRLGLQAPASFGKMAQYISSYSDKTKHELHDAADVNVLKEYVKSSKRKIILYMPHHTFGKDKDIEVEQSIGLDKWDSEVVRYHDSGTTDLDSLLNIGYNTLITTMPVDDLLRSQKQIGTFATVADKVVYISIAGKT